MTTNDMNAGWAPHDPEATLRAPAGNPPGAAPQASAPPASTPPASPSYAPPAPPAAPTYAQPTAPSYPQPSAAPQEPTYTAPPAASPPPPPLPGFGQPAAPAQPLPQPGYAPAPGGQQPLPAPGYAPQPEPGQPTWTGPQSQPLAPVTNSSTAKVVATSVAKSLIIRAVSFAVVAAIGLGLYWVFVVHKNSNAVKDALPAAGKCFSWDTSTGAKVLPCTDPLAVYKSETTTTSAAGQAACDAVGAYANFQVTSDIRNNSQTGTICGALNLKVGDCVNQPTGAAADFNTASTVPCATAGSSDEKVLSINKVASAQAATSDATANSTCGADATDYLSDVSAPAILCMGKP